MCYQVVEVYSNCRCLYYQHAVDRCFSYGRLGHEISKRTVPVGYSCSTHSREKVPTISARRSGPGSALKGPELEIKTPIKKAERLVSVGKVDNSENLGSLSGKSSIKPQEVSHPQQTPRINELHAEYPDLWEIKEALSDQYDTDDSIDSRSIISQASTATTVDEDALEALFRGLLNQNGLYNLWPQIIAGQINQRDARQMIERFLRRFAEDLENLAAKPGNADDKNSHRIIISASRFVRRCRVEIASRICQVHGKLQGKINTDAEWENGIGILAAEDVVDTDGDPFAFSVAEEFIFRTEPIVYLEANLCAHIRQRKQIRVSRVATKIRSFTCSAVQLFCQTPMLPNMRRVGWTCICGCRVVDDYESVHEGAMEAFEERLKYYNQPIESIQQEDNTEQSTAMAPKSPMGAMATAFRWLSEQLIKTNSPVLPNHRQDDIVPPTDLGCCVKTTGAAQANHNFVLLCVPYLRWGLRLYNSEVCRINSDQQFFQLLRQCYFRQRRGSARGILRIFTKVREIKFVKFEVFRNKLVDVRACPSMPTAGNDYIYDPMPPDAIPPIGSNLLMHLFENPDHADVSLFLYHRFPKKLRAQLEACSTKGSSMGWGVEFVEGVNWYAVFLAGCLGFLICLLVAVSYTAAKGDIQGGFGVASFLLTFVGFCIGILRTI